MPAPYRVCEEVPVSPPRPDDLSSCTGSESEGDGSESDGCSDTMKEELRLRFNSLSYAVCANTLHVKE